MPEVFLISLLSFLLAFVLYKITIPLLNEFLLDKPNDRSSHKMPIPKGGGIVFVFVSTLGLLIKQSFFALFLLPLAIIGLIDDKLNLPRITRYFVQLIISSIIIFSSEFIYQTLESYNLLLFLLIYFFLIFIGTGIINFINFMDGIDGLVTGSFILILIYFSITTNSDFLIICSTLISFLFFNWSPAKLFMGDTGSLYLGGLMVYLLSRSNSIEFCFSLFLISSPLILDPLFCLIQRFKNKKNIFIAHKEHFYQRLHIKGFKHSLISKTYMVAILFLILCHYFGGLSILIMGLGIIIVIGFAINQLLLSDLSIFKNKL